MASVTAIRLLPTASVAVAAGIAIAIALAARRCTIAPGLRHAFNEPRRPRSNLRGLLRFTTPRKDYTMPPAPLARSGKSQRTTDSPITYFIQKALENPGLVSFAAGLVDEGSFPVAEVGSAAAGITTNAADGAGRAAIRLHAGAAGSARTGAAPRLHRGWRQPRGTEPHARGRGYYHRFATTALSARGTLASTPATSSSPKPRRTSSTTASLQSHGVRVLAVPMDDHGMRMDALESLLERLEAQRRAQPREADLHGRLLPEPDRSDAERRATAASWSNSRAGSAPITAS